MKRYLQITLLVLVSGSVHADFYVDDGEYVRTVHGDENQFQADEWQIRLYKRNDATTGDWHWGVITADSAADAMTKLQDSQEIEQQLEQRTGEPWGELTCSNPLGPIAILGHKDKQKHVQSRVQLLKEKLSGLWDAQKKLHQALSSQENGDAFKKADGSANEYANQFKSTFKFNEKLNRITESTSDSEGYLLRQLGELSSEIDKSQKQLNAHQQASLQEERHSLSPKSADITPQAREAEDATDSLQNEKEALLKEQLQLQTEQLRMQNDLLRLQIEAAKTQIKNTQTEAK